MIGVGVQSTVNSLSGMSWQPGTSSPADLLIGAVLRSHLHDNYASCSPVGFQKFTANEHTVGSYYTVNNEGSGLRRAPPALTRFDERDAKSELGIALAGEPYMSVLSKVV